MKNYPLHHVEKCNDFNAFVEKIAKDYKGKPAIHCYTETGEKISKSYTELADDVYALAEYLAERGLRGKHIAILSQNSYIYVVSFLAIAYIGSVAVPIDQEQMPDTILSLISFADCDLVLVSELMLDRFEDIAVFSDKPLMVLSDNLEREDGFYKALAGGKKLIEQQGRTCQNTAIDPNQNVVIIYTSGTTSTAKAVMLSQRALLSNVYGALETVALPRSVFFSLPLYHAYGLNNCVINTLADGLELCINGDIRYMLRDFMLFKPAMLMAVPLIAEMILKELISAYEKAQNTNEGFSRVVAKLAKGPEKANEGLVAFKERVFPGLDLIFCGGAYLSAQIAKALHKFGIFVIEGYGITECSPLVSLNRNHYYKRDTVGVLLPCFEVKIDDGEILLRGACIMNGYYKAEKLTQEAIVDGWFKTGDLGHVDSDGFLVISGRKKNIIVLKNGKNVSPEELENLLHQVPLIKEAMVYGSSVGNATDDVLPAVTIYPDPTETKGLAPFEVLAALQSAVDEINRNLPAYKQIRHVNIRENEFPKTSIKKIKRSK